MLNLGEEKMNDKTVYIVDDERKILIDKVMKEGVKVDEGDGVAFYSLNIEDRGYVVQVKDYQLKEGDK